MFTFCRVSLFFSIFLLFSSLSSVPVSAQSCVDTDGDGWGWDGSDSCVAQTLSTPTSAVCVDSDGDGWGWDGADTCLVTTAANTGSSVGSVNSGCVDTDGDGWGWGPTGSCVVQGGNDASGSTSSGGQSSSGSATTGSGNNPPATSGAFNRSRDLVALHFDHAPDPDDGHAAAAAFVVQDQLQLAVQVVGGTHGVYSAGRYIPASESLMNSIWGQNWLDAHNTRPSAVDQSAIRWAGTLAAGGDVWVAEGGPSDYTAAVVRLLQQRHPEFQTRNRIHVVQHSQWNEDHALAADINFVRSNTNYIRIEDGNEPNSTADFRGFRQSFVDSALNSQYRGVWNVAFAYLSPSVKLDFSDTVELMYILGMGTSQIANADDFARVFFQP